MPFNSIGFLIFFSVFICIYYILRREYKTDILLIGSWVFYSSLNPLNLGVLLFITSTTYLFAHALNRNHSSKMVMLIAISLIITVLLFTKYFLEFSELFLPNHDKPYSISHWVTSLGISFYSLQAISLLVDVKNKIYHGNLSFKKVALFLSFFPQSIAGPIHRANDLIPQFAVKETHFASNFKLGIKTLIWGYFCKLMVADKLSLLTTPVFDNYQKYDGFILSTSTLLFTLQIYFDFYGYSLIAIGLGRMLGFSININFNAPYSVASFKEFWHRWHITLSKWMRDYVYIPLGGSKKSYIVFALSITATFLVSGIWHGITLNFMLWGFVHSILYLSEDGLKRTAKSTPTKRDRYITYILRWLLFYLLISFTWLIFRTHSLNELQEILKKVFNLPQWSTSQLTTIYFTTSNLTFLVIIGLSMMLIQNGFIKKRINSISTTFPDIISDFFWVSCCLILLIMFGDIGNQEFLYFKF